jgi:hypothetical protein
MKIKNIRNQTIQLSQHSNNVDTYRTLMRTVPESHLAGLRVRYGPEQDGDTPLYPRLPVLDYLQRHIGHVDSSIGGFFGLQHLLGSTATLIDKIISGVVSPNDVYLLGKPYSANRQVVKFLRENRGYWVHPETLEQPLDRPNDGEMDRRIRDVLVECRQMLLQPQNHRRRLLLVDDGGRAIRMLHTAEFIDICEHFTCVEQTRAGIRAIENVDLRIPVVNVAESWVKLEHESPLIAQSVNTELMRQLRVLEKTGLSASRQALVIGFGAIGRAVSAELSRCGRKVTVYDPDIDRRKAAFREGFRLCNDLHTALEGGGLIVGCTGHPVLDDEDYDHIADGSILVSASSADVEFRGWKLRTNAVPLGRPQSWLERGGRFYRRHDGSVPAEDNHPCFCLYLVQRGEKSFYLVNGGFPVNFTGEIDPIAPEAIQLTRGLLYCGAFQASRTYRPGLHDLDDWMQRRLLSVYDRLTTPPFEGGATCLQSA